MSAQALDLSFQCRFCKKQVQWLDQLGTRGCLYHPGSLISGKYACCGLIPALVEKAAARIAGLQARDRIGCTSCDHLAANEGPLVSMAVLPALHKRFSAPGLIEAATKAQEEKLRPFLYVSSLYWASLPDNIKADVENEVANEEEVPADVLRSLTWLPKQVSIYDRDPNAEAVIEATALPKSTYCREALAAGASLDPPSKEAKKRGEILLRLRPAVHLVAIKRAELEPHASTLQRIQKACLSFSF